MKKKVCIANGGKTARDPGKEVEKYSNVHYI